MAAIALAAAGVAGLVALTTPVRLLDALTADLRTAFLAPRASTRIVIAAIDEGSIARWRAEEAGCACRSPLNERHLAALLTTLDAMGASVIGIDLLADPAADPAGRAVLIDTLSRIRAKVVMLAQGDAALAAAAPASVTFARAELGLVDDADGVLRRHDPAPEGEASFPMALAAAGGDAPGADRPFAIRFRAPRGEGRAFDAYPAADIGMAPREWIEGAAVLVGRMETDPAAPPLLEDLHLTPLRLRAAYAAGLYGVEGHAHVLDQIRTGDRTIMIGPFGAGVLLVLAAGLGVAAGRRPGGWALGLAAGAGAAVVVGLLATLAYAAAGILAPVAGPFLAFVLAFMLANRALSGDLERQRRFLRQAFGQYLSPQVIAQLAARPQGLALGAETRAVTVVATDLQGFSGLVGSLPADRLAAVMNAYFDALIDVLWRHGALIDKLVGDGLYAIFGAPEPAADHAARALACVRELDARAEAFRDEAQARFGVALGATRIGVESGEALIGNFGGALRFDYTAYGEVVVRAARLEQANKGTDGRVLLGPGLAAAVGPEALRAEGLRTLPGLAEPIAVYRLV